MSITKVKTFVALDPGPCECPVLSAMSQPFKYKHRAHLHSSYLPNSLPPPLSPLDCPVACPPGSFSHLFTPEATRLHPATWKSAPREVSSECVGAETEGCFSIINYFKFPHIWLGSCLPKSLSSHGFPCSAGSSSAPHKLAISPSSPLSLYFPSGHCVLTTPKPMSLADVPLFIY